MITAMRGAQPSDVRRTVVISFSRRSSCPSWPLSRITLLARTAVAAQFPAQRSRTGPASAERHFFRRYCSCCGRSNVLRQARASGNRSSGIARVNWRKPWSWSSSVISAVRLHARAPPSVAKPCVRADPVSLALTLSTDMGYFGARVWNAASGSSTTCAPLRRNRSSSRAVVPDRGCPSSSATVGHASPPPPPPARRPGGRLGSGSRETRRRFSSSARCSRAAASSRRNASATPRAFPM